MANCHDVHIRARLPFDWTNNLTDEEARVWCAWVMSPSTGLELTQSPSGGENNERGGYTTMYCVTLSGMEAIRSGALAILADSMRKQAHGEVEALARDIDNDDAFCEILTVEEHQAMTERVERQVKEMMEGKHWETTELGNGISQSVLVDD